MLRHDHETLRHVMLHIAKACARYATFTWMSPVTLNWSAFQHSYLPKSYKNAQMVNQAIFKYYTIYSPGALHTGLARQNAVVFGNQTDPNFSTRS